MISWAIDEAAHSGEATLFRMIMARGGGVCYGSIHRKSYVNSPASLTPHLSLRDDPGCCSPADQRRGGDTEARPLGC